MLGRLAAAAAVIALAGCAGMESAGRSARTSGPTQVVSTAPPPAAPRPAVTTPAPTPPPTPTQAAPPAPALSVPPPATTAPPTQQTAPPPPSVQAPPVQTSPPPQVMASRDRPVAAGDEQVIVPGQRERQVPTPADPRSTAERMQDIRAWDQCVMRVQNAFEADPMSAQLDEPEDYCARSLGMANRTAVPESRIERQR